MALRTGVLVPVQISDSRHDQDMMLLDTILLHFWGRGKGALTLLREIGALSSQECKHGHDCGMGFSTVVVHFPGLVSIFHVCDLLYTFVIYIVAITVHFLISLLFSINCSYLKL